MYFRVTSHKHQGASSHWPLNCFFKSLPSLKAKNPSSSALLALWAGHSLVTSGFPTQRASIKESVSMSWCHYAKSVWGRWNNVHTCIFTMDLNLKIMYISKTRQAFMSCDICRCCNMLIGIMQCDRNFRPYKSGILSTSSIGEWDRFYRSLLSVHSLSDLSSV